MSGRKRSATVRCSAIVKPRGRHLHPALKSLEKHSLYCTNRDYTCRCWIEQIRATDQLNSKLLLRGVPQQHYGVENAIPCPKAVEILKNAIPKNRKKRRRRKQGKTEKYRKKESHLPWCRTKEPRRTWNLVVKTLHIIGLEFAKTDNLEAYNQIRATCKELSILLPIQLPLNWGIYGKSMYLQSGWGMHNPHKLRLFAAIIIQRWWRHHRRGRCAISDSAAGKYTPTYLQQQLDLLKEEKQRKHQAASQPRNSNRSSGKTEI